MFSKAERKKSKLRLAISGPSGSGKTYGAILIAKSLGGKIAFIDTERGSASLYSHLADFDVLELEPPYAPERFVTAVEAAEKSGYNVIIIDSITHEWSGAGGCLQMNDALAKSKYQGNSWSAWNETTPKHQKFLDKINSTKMHCIATMRSKTETAQQENKFGKKEVVKLGMKDEQRDGTEYEFTIKLDLTHDGHYAVASKDRTGLFTDKTPEPISEKTGKILVEWLETGTDPEPKIAVNDLDRFIFSFESIGSIEDLDSYIKDIKPQLDTLPKNDQKTLRDLYTSIKLQLSAGSKK